MRNQTLSKSEESFFREFFEHATSAGLRWMLMRNYLGFPATMGNDLDVFFPRSQLWNAVGAFRDLLARAGGEIIHRHQRDYVYALWFRLPGCGPLHIDFYHGVTTWHGLHYLTEDELWDQRCDYLGWPVPRPAHEAIALVTTSLLWGGFYKDRYASRVSHLLARADERQAYNDLMDRSFGKASALGFDPADSVADRMRDIACGRRLRAGLKRTSTSRSAIGTWMKLARYWLGELRTVVLPPGLCVIVEGDESGAATRKVVSECGDALFGGATELEPSDGSNRWNRIRRIWLAMARNQLVILRNEVSLPWWRKALKLTGGETAGDPCNQIERVLKARLP